MLEKAKKYAEIGKLEDSYVAISAAIRIEQNNKKTWGSYTHKCLNYKGQIYAY
jgi:hypothetical protein